MHLPQDDRTKMLALVSQWQGSGLRQKDFYQQHNIQAHVFYYWLKCYRKLQDNTCSSNQFVELQPASAEGQNNIEIRLPGGVQIFCNEQVSVDYLKALIR